MAEKTRMGVTVFVADVFGSDGAAALLSACSLVRCCSHQFVFPCVIVVYVVLEHSASLCDQLQGPRYVDSLHVTHSDNFISEVRVTGGSPPHYDSSPSFGMRSSSMRRTGRNHRSLRWLSRMYTGKTSTRQDISVGYFVLPGYAYDTVDVSREECVEPSLLPGTASPCLAAIQQCVGKTCIVDRQLCFHRHLGACPHSSRETSDSWNCLPNPLVELCVQKEVVIMQWWWSRGRLIGRQHRVRSRRW